MIRSVRSEADSQAEPLDPASPFFVENTARLQAAREIGPVLDLACGRGRHAVAAARLGLAVVALDRNFECLAAIADELDRAAQAQNAEQDTAEQVPPGSIACVRADLEGGGAVPLAPGRFGAVLVFRYLHRPLMPSIEGLLAPGGLLLYETFTRAQRDLGWGPTRDAFLLESGELPGLFPHLTIESYDEGPTRDRRPAITGRLRARRPLQD